MTRLWLGLCASLLYAAPVQAAVTITWKANTEADLAGYIVQYATTCATAWADLATTTQSTFLDTAHDNGAYRVLAFDAIGQRSNASACLLVAQPAAAVTSVIPSTTGATVRWTGAAKRLRYASDDTSGYVVVTEISANQSLFTHTRAWNRTQSWVCYQVEDAATGTWTEQGCNNFSSVIWEPSPIDPSEPPPVPDPPLIPSPFVVEEHGSYVTLTYGATDCPRGIARSTTGNKMRTLTLTCLK